MDDPIVTFIIPVYNVRDCVERCVRSVLRQTEPSLECICIDDGSTDGSGAVLDGLSREDARVIVIHQANGGVSKARNAGLGLARGRYVVFVDSDDEIGPGFLKAPLEAFAADNDLDLWIGQRVTVDMEYTPHPKQPCAIPSLTTYCPISRFLRVDGRYYLYCVWGKVFRRSVITENGLDFLEGVNISEDGLFIAKYYAVSRKVLVDGKEGHYFHCHRAGSLVRRHWADQVSEQFAVIDDLARCAKNPPYKGKVEPLVAQWALGRLSVIYHSGYEIPWMHRYCMALCLHPAFRKSILGNIIAYGPLPYRVFAMVLWPMPGRLTVGLLMSLLRVKNALSKRC